MKVTEITAKTADGTEFTLWESSDGAWDVESDDDIGNGEIIDRFNNEGFHTTAADAITALSQILAEA